MREIEVKAEVAPSTIMAGAMHAGHVGGQVQVGQDGNFYKGTVLSVKHETPSLGRGLSTTLFIKGSGGALVHVTVDAETYVVVAS